MRGIKNALRVLSLWPSMVCVPFILLSFIFYMLVAFNVPRSCTPQSAVTVWCLSHYYSPATINESIVSGFIIIDGLLIVIISSIFSANYETMLKRLRESYGDKNGDSLLCSSGLSSNFLTAALLLALLIPIWLEAPWFIFSFSFFCIYYLFIRSNKYALDALDSEEFPIHNRSVFQEFYIENIVIATEENIHAFFGYACLFVVVTSAFFVVSVTGAKPAIHLIMKSFLAGAATIHIALSALKFKTLLKRENGTAVQVARAAGYKMGEKPDSLLGAPPDPIRVFGAALSEEIDRYCRRYGIPLTILLFVIVSVTGAQYAVSAHLARQETEAPATVSITKSAVPFGND